MRVIVVGGGIVGLSTAWALVGRGHEVTLLERGTIPDPLAASGDHHRIIRRAYGRGNPYGRLMSEAFAAWDALWADLGASHYDPRGFLILCQSDDDPAASYRDGLVDEGWPCATLAPAEAAARWPVLDPDRLRWAAFSPEGGALHCRAIARDLAAWLRRHGATLRERAEVVGLAPGRVALADGDTLVADRVVIAAGAWVTSLIPDLKGTLAPWRTAVAYLVPPADLAGAWAETPVILEAGGTTDGWAIPPTGGGGLKVGTGHHKVPSPDAMADREPRPGEGEALRDRYAWPIRRMAEHRVAHVATCAYTFTADERFAAFGRPEGLVVSACSGHGYKFGAAVGRRVAEAVETGDVGHLSRWLAARA